MSGWLLYSKVLSVLRQARPTDVPPARAARVKETAGIDAGLPLHG
jgi:hypothetical protein